MDRCNSHLILYACVLGRSVQVSPTKALELEITCDNTIEELYLGGEPVTISSNSWDETNTVQVPAGVGLIAVKCYDGGVKYSL